MQEASLIGVSIRPVHYPVQGTHLPKLSAAAPPQLHCLQPSLLHRSTSTSHWSLILHASCLSIFTNMALYRAITSYFSPCSCWFSCGSFAGLQLNLLLLVWLTLTLKMEAVHSFEISVNSWNIWYYITHDSTVHRFTSVETIQWMLFKTEYHRIKTIFHFIHIPISWRLLWNYK
jgi:hypothetical protein